MTEVEMRMSAGLLLQRTALEVIVVSFRSPDLLRRCLQSLQDVAAEGPTAAVHVVDNASGDGTPEMVAREFPEVRLHRLERNKGFSVANNVAIRETAGPFVLVLNPDTEMRPGVLSHMLGLMADRPDVGMSGCRLVQLDGTFDHAAKRSFPTPTSALAHFIGLGRRVDKGALAQYRATDVDENGLGYVDAVNGAFMLVRREALEDVGLFDEGYWLYMEDLDWCARFWEKGWKVLYDGSVTAIHVKGGAAGKQRTFKPNLHFHRGMGRFYRSHQAVRNPWWLNIAVYVGIGLKFTIAVVSSAVARGLSSDN